MESASPTSSSAGATPSFSLFYVLIGCAALLGCVVFPIAFLFVLRRFRRQQPPLGYQLPVSLGDNVEGKPQQGEPKLFDVYVKPGLEVHEPRFEYIQPVAVRAAAPITNPLSSPPSVLRTRHPSGDPNRRVDKAGALVEKDGFRTYDVAVLIVMPHPRPADQCNELGEYAIATTEFVSPAFPDNSSPP